MRFWRARGASLSAIAAGKGGEMSKAGKVDDAIRYWGYVEQFYTNSNFYATGLLQLAQNYEKKGDRDAAKAYYKKYLPVETSPANRNVAQMQLAQMFQ